jgi:hypothetical protein
MHTKEQLRSMYEEQQHWLQRLHFLKEEILHFDVQLGKLTDDQGLEASIVSVQALRLDFLVQRNLLNTMTDELMRHEDILCTMETAPVQMSVGSIRESHAFLRDEFDVFEKRFHELRAQFNALLDQVGA